MKKYWLILLLAALNACVPVTPAPIVLPDIEPILTPSPIVPVMYELQQPEAESLLAMIDSVLLMESKWTPSDDRLYIADSSGSSLHRLIGDDLEKYYLNGFPDADNFVTQVAHPWEMESFSDLGSFGPVLQISLLQYINKYQDVLEGNKPFNLPNINIRTYSMDIDGDGNLEWLIGEKYQEYNLENWFLINKQVDGRYYFVQDIDFGWVGIWNSSTEIEI
ncbi:MAG TPA: hypothetical protein VJ972_08860, partial [Anaerolineales bacterium]|nr:hypothetical protein [Anaerolineales bacterium]